MRYQVFAYDELYSAGGIFDLMTTVGSESEAVEIAKKLTSLGSNTYDAAHVYDVESKEFVYKCYKEH